jgi:hypothetical protein
MPEPERTPAQILEVVLRAIPFPNQVRDLDLAREPDALRFTWRGTRFRVSDTLHVEESDGRFLSGSDLATLLGALLRRQADEDRRGAGRPP